MVHTSIAFPASHASSPAGGAPSSSGNPVAVVRSTDVRHWLIFELRDRPFALAISEVVEIVPVPAMSNEPDEESQTPSILAGIMNLGGVAVPVLRTALLLEVPEPETTLTSPVIVVHSGIERFGLLASAVRGIVSLPQDTTLAMPAHSLTSSAIKLDERIVPIVSLPNLVLAQEQSRLESLRRARQRRLDEVITRGEAHA